MIRLFVALRPPPAVRTQLAATMEGVIGARWQDDDQLHLTLRFIGEVERPLAEDITGTLGQIYAEAPTIALSGVGRFERRGATTTLWAGVTPHDALAALHRKVDQACIRAGLPAEHRAYLPHVTLARLARGAAGPDADRWIADHAGLASAPFALPHMMLYESVLTRDGARYEPVMRWPLGTGGQAVGSL
ncbi:RNA 2',3'-cyclic phosphodiesterase [Sphingomonas sp. PB2P19]|uniref:RNA 2',3'-cyclic phosphodiesterase n=1 Tax=Sphingomonas rhamnosi TaxID=3096156 RepID=UPI002FC8269A